MSTMTHTAALAASFLLWGSFVEAAPMAYEFSGEIYWVDDPGDLLDGSIQPGTVFSGRFTFDSSVEDSNSNSVLGEFTGPTFSMSLDVGSYSWFSGAGNAQIRVQNSDLDNMVFGTSGYVEIGGLSIALSGGLQDSTGLALSSDAIPTSSLSLSSFTAAGLSVKTSGLPPAPGALAVAGTFTAFSVVPEPVSLALMAGALSLLRRRRGHNYEASSQQT